MSGITPCLWFDGNAEEAAEFYASLFPNSQIDAVHRAPSDYPSGKAGDVLMRSIGFIPAATALTPSRTICAPMFANLSIG